MYYPIVIFRQFPEIRAFLRVLSLGVHIDTKNVYILIYLIVDVCNELICVDINNKNEIFSLCMCLFRGMNRNARLPNQRHFRAKS